MSKLFGKLKTDGLEQTQDRLGGGGGLFESGAYLARIKHFYAHQSASSPSQGIMLVADIDGREFRTTLWVTDREGKNYWERDGKKNPLAGFTVADEICQVTTGLPLSEQDTEERIVKVYDPETQAEVNKGVPTLTEVIGKEVTLGIVKSLRKKQVKGPDNKYVDDPEGGTREDNEVEKVFHHPTGLTVPEARQGIEEAVFLNSWKEKNTGVTRDRTGGKKNGNGGKPAAPPQAGSGSAPAKKLFGK